MKGDLMTGLSKQAQLLWAKKENYEGQERWLPLLAHLIDAKNVINWLYFHQGVRGRDAFNNLNCRIHVIHRQYGNSLEKAVVVLHDSNDFLVAFPTELGCLVGTDKVLRQDVDRGNDLVAVVRQKFVAQVGLGQVAVLDEGRLIGDLRGNRQHFLEKLRRQDMGKNIDGFHKNSSLLVDKFSFVCVHYTCG